MPAHILIVVTIASSVYGAHTGSAGRTDEVRWSWPVVTTQRFEDRSTCENAAKQIARMATKHAPKLSMTCQPA